MKWHTVALRLALALVPLLAAALRDGRLSVVDAPHLLAAVRAALEALDSKPSA